MTLHTDLKMQKSILAFGKDTEFGTVTNMPLPLHMLEAGLPVVLSLPKGAVLP